MLSEVITAPAIIFHQNMRYRYLLELRLYGPPVCDNNSNLEANITPLTSSISCVCVCNSFYKFEAHKSGFEASWLQLNWRGQGVGLTKNDGTLEGGRRNKKPALVPFDLQTNSTTTTSGGVLSAFPFGWSCVPLWWSNADPRVLTERVITLYYTQIETWRIPLSKAVESVE